MIDFKFSYDQDNDDLFVYLENKKSAGAIEFGNFIFDFDEKGNLVAMQIIEASQTFSKLMKKIINFAEMTGIKVEAVNFRNMEAVNMKITTPKETTNTNILVPNIRSKTKSPALSY